MAKSDREIIENVMEEWFGRVEERSLDSPITVPALKGILEQAALNENLSVEEVLTWLEDYGPLELGQVAARLRLASAENQRITS